MNENPSEIREKSLQDSSSNNKTGKKKNFAREIAELLILSLVIVIPFRLFIAQPFIVEGASMYPTFKQGDYLVVDEISWRFSEPGRGEVVVFKYPKNPKKSFIKRIIGLPGEIISIKEGKVTIASGTYPEGLLLDEPYVKAGKEETLSYTLGQNEYFVLGDNRAQSADSRIWGAVPAKNIVGRPILRLYPPSLLPGDSAHFEE